MIFRLRKMFLSSSRFMFPFVLFVFYSCLTVITTNTINQKCKTTIMGKYFGMCSAHRNTWQSYHSSNPMAILLRNTRNIYHSLNSEMKLFCLHNSLFCGREIISKLFQFTGFREVHRAEVKCIHSKDKQNHINVVETKELQFSIRFRYVVQCARKEKIGKFINGKKNKCCYS